MTFPLWGRGVVIGTLIGLCTAGDTLAVSRFEQKTVIVKLCTGVVDEYGAFIAGFVKPKSVIALQHEYAHCAAAIEEYDDFRR